MAPPAGAFAPAPASTANPSSAGPLARFKVLDLTRVRAGPTAVRQLADWGAGDQDRIPRRRRRPRRGAARAGLPEPAPQQAQPDPGPESARRASRSFAGWSRDADVLVENFRPDVKFRLGDRLRDAARDQPAARLRQHLRLRPGRPLSRPARLRPDRPGHGRADVDHRPAGPGAGARRHPDRRSHRRHLRRHGHPDRAARTRAVRRGPVGAELPAGRPDRHARFPGRALD